MLCLLGWTKESCGGRFGEAPVTECNTDTGRVTELYFLCTRSAGGGGLAISTSMLGTLLLQASDAECKSASERAVNPLIYSPDDILSSFGIRGM